MFTAVSRSQAPAQEWPENLSQMTAIEAALKCSICQDWFNTPKILPCGHTYCSNCIRHHGEQQSRTVHSRTCPECRASWQEADLQLKPVHCLAVAVRALQAVKPQIIAAVQQQAIDKHTSTGSDSHKEPHTRKRPRPTNSADCDMLAEQPQLLRAGQTSGALSIGIEPEKSNPAALKVLPAGCGCCPMCNRVFSMRFLQSHVDSCLISTEAADPSIKAGDVYKHTGDGVVDLTDPSGDAAPEATVPQLPPKICFQLLKEKEARKKLQDVGLSALGEKHELEKRYQSFRQYVLTAHDKGQHVPLRKLAKSYTTAEQRRAQAVSAPQKTVEGADSDFSSLIAVAKRRMKEHKAKIASVSHSGPHEGTTKEGSPASDHDTDADCAD